MEGRSMRMTEEMLAAKMEDCYRELGLNGRASWEEVKEAYSRSLRTWDPDGLAGPAEKERARLEQRRIRTAYEWLREFRLYGMSRLNPHDPQKQFELANDFMCGVAFPQDFPEAVNQYRKASERGHAEAQFALYEIYGDGLTSGLPEWHPPVKVPGIQRDAAEAYKWLLVAAAQGHRQATFRKEHCPLLGLSPQEAAEGKRRASEFFARNPHLCKSPAQTLLERAGAWFFGP